jgi:hypothetical protein
MPIAYTEEFPVHHEAINGETASTLIAGIHDAVVQAGWFYTPISGGYEYTLISPQGLGAKCRIVDSGTPPGQKGRISIRFRSLDDVRTGINNAIIYDTNRFYEVTCDQCQLALSLTGVTSEEAENGAHAHAFIGGIPFTSEYSNAICQAEQPEVAPDDITEVWWSSGDGIQGDTEASYGFRSNWRNRFQWESNWNGAQLSGYANPEASMLRLWTIAQPAPDFAGQPSAQQTRWPNGEGIDYEPMLIFADEKAGRARVLGQIWNAFRRSIDQPSEQQVVTQEIDPDTAAVLGSFTWRNFQHYQGSMATAAKGSYYGSLFLLTHIEPASELDSNYVY